jgi:hypothetical protein
MEVNTESLRGMFKGDVQKYVTTAYWRHTTIDASATTTSETGKLDFSDPSTRLTVSFDKVY